MTTDLYVLLTMDVETARRDITAQAAGMSPSGPWDYVESERSIRGYASVASAYGFPLTLLAHPEVAVNNRGLLLELQEQGACLGLHLHPYKFEDGRYTKDLGAYSAEEQREMIGAAMAVWQAALGQRPLYFRGGFFSANDNTFRVLQELGFRGAGLSIPGRILPDHGSVWAGAEPYPHRANLAFRQLRGTSDLVEVPVAVDYQRPVQQGTAGEVGYEWPYVPAEYEHREVVGNILRRIRSDAPRYGAIVLDTHNDQDFLDPGHPARVNLELILSSIVSVCQDLDMRPIGVTLETMADLVLSDAAPQ